MDVRERRKIQRKISDKESFLDLVNKYRNSLPRVVELLRELEHYAEEGIEDPRVTGMFIEVLSIENILDEEIIQGCVALYPALKSFYYFYMQEENFPGDWEQNFPPICNSLLARDDLEPRLRNYITRQARKFQNFTLNVKGEFAQLVFQSL